MPETSYVCDIRNFCYENRNVNCLTIVTAVLNMLFFLNKLIGFIVHQYSVL